MEILNSYPVLEVRNAILTVTCILLAIFVPIFIAAASEAFSNSNLKSIILTILILITFFVAAMYFGQEIPSGITEYQVILSDDYPAKDLYEKYEVIKTEGKIWYIRDKEKKDENVDN